MKQADQENYWIFYVQTLHGKPRCTTVGEVVTEQLFPPPEDLSVPGWCHDPAPSCYCAHGDWQGLLSSWKWIVHHGNNWQVSRAYWVNLLLTALKLSEWEESCNGFILRVNICRVLFCSTMCIEVFIKVHNRLTTRNLYCKFLLEIYRNRNFYRFLHLKIICHFC